MKNILLIAIIMISQNSSSALPGKERYWKFVQSIGGISIGAPKLKNKQWLLPVICNVAGLREVTTKPTTLNSAIVWSDTEARIEEGVIYLSIKTTLASMESKSSVCGPANLGTINPGKYRVMYLSPDKSLNPIGVVEIGT